MIVYKCDMCGKTHEEIGKMTNVIISHAGTFQVCKDCTSKLLKSLNAWGVKDGDSE